MSVNISRTDSYLSQVLARWQTSPPFRTLIQRLEEPTEGRLMVTGLSGSSGAVLLNALTTNLKRPILVVTQRSEEASDFYEDLLFLMGPEKVAHFPTRQILPYDFRAPVGEVMGQRISSLAGLLHGSVSVVVCPVRALLEPTIAVDTLKESSVILNKGDEIDIDELVDRLVRLGFQRVPLVEEVGDFARRGGLIDIFTPDASAPVRIEFFGDEIDTIREFDVGSQRSVGRLDRVAILPKREIPITQETVEQYLRRLPAHDADYIRSRYINDPELPGLEWLAVMFDIERG